VEGFAEDSEELEVEVETESEGADLALDSELVAFESAAGAALDSAVLLSEELEELFGA
jgi:hypothetical protein